MKRNLYLKTTPVEEAVEKYISALERSRRANDSGELKAKSEWKPETQWKANTEWIDVYDSLGRVTCAPVFAKCCSPLFNCAAMDGIAVKSSDTRGASQTRPLTLKLGKDYLIVDTGDPVKYPFDAVIMAEDLIEIDDETVQITQSAPGWQHVRPIGEDIVSGEMILSGRHVIRPVDIGVMLASGNVKVEVFSKPKVGIIPTGTEIIRPEETPKEGDIIDSNSGMFAAMVTELGGVPTRYPIAEDDYEKIKQEIFRGLRENDMVIVNAGSSAGTEDYTVHILREIGQVIVHGVAMKPGKPVILAIVGAKPVIGLPGYPVSAYLAFENFVAPVLRILGGPGNFAVAGDIAGPGNFAGAGDFAVAGDIAGPGNFAGAKSFAGAEGKTIEAVLSKRIVSSLKHREYVRVKVGKVGGRFVASPLARGAAAAMSLVRADGFCIVPQNSEGFEAGQTVAIQLYKDIADIENTLISIGSHDMMLDLINDMMTENYCGMSLSSSHVGSMAGLMALSRGETVIAPTHLLDEETGEYNLSYIKKIFGCDEAGSPGRSGNEGQSGSPGRSGNEGQSGNPGQSGNAGSPGRIALIKGVDRIQGIMVKKGNPLGIKGVEDLTRVRYVNRQRGAGTRVLLDYKLKEAGIAPSDIDGYDKEAATHTAVAACVASEEIDAGMGIKPAAAAMGLDFVEVGVEEYDFALREESLQLPQVKAFLEILKSDEFHRKLDEIGGYGYHQAGKVVIVE